MSSEKFCLRWNDFESNISSAFRELRDDKDFFDVTLACDDDQLQAHKVILSACSPFFRTILRRNKHEHPLLYLKGVKYADLVSVLNFMYQGEVNVAQEELNSFLAVAEDLKVKGLTQNGSNSKPVSRNEPPKPMRRDPPEKEPSQPLKRSRPAPSFLPPSFPPSYQHADDEIEEVVPIKSEPATLPAVLTSTLSIPSTPPCDQPYSAGVVADPDMEYEVEEYGDYDTEYEGSGAQQEGNKDFSSTINQVLAYNTETLLWQCTVCGKSNSDKARIRRHAEVHFKGFIHACPHCGVEKKTSTALRIHIHNYHIKKQ
eukprot:GFUD01014242.1.p1 GENE.GFUD01014242.1~~GFUD01014242.1.p1  ORF type:complete len:314 (+),score=96.19 GFUD01014242.1:30-971(+)